MKRLLRRGGVFLLILIATLWAATLLMFAGRGKTPPIAGSRSIATLEATRIGGVDQWLLIRGADTAKPVVLFLHGGPGMPSMFLAHAFQRELEHHFVVVQWDRRGAGKSYDAGKDPSSINVRQLLDDTFEVTQLLRQRFAQTRIYLVCHSWGTYLGLLAIREHPEYYSAYVGMGQIAGNSARVNAIQREFVLARAHEQHDAEVASRFAKENALVDEDLLFRYQAELYHARSFWPLLAEGLRAPEYTFRDAFNVKAGANKVNRAMNYNVEPGLLKGEIGEFEIPIFFFLGRHDYNTPSSLAAEYLQRLKAPEKHLIWFEESAHFPFYEERRKFVTEMLRIDKMTRAFWEHNQAVSVDCAAMIERPRKVPDANALADELGGVTK
jgi:pimeloyl-ACP methyl ester carboxylesterase